MSKFDYRDPGCDPDYCNPLTPEPDDDSVEYCLYCNRVFLDPPTVRHHKSEWPYCSPDCAIRAEVEEEGK